MPPVLPTKLQINQKEKVSRTVFFLEMGLKIFSYLMIFLAVYLGSRQISYEVCLWVLIICCSYQVIRLYVYIFGSFFWKGPSLEFSQAGGESELPLISIIVPCFNEEKVISSCLGSLERIKYPRFEIIVVDDGSSDATPQIVAEFAKKSAIQTELHQQINGGKSQALNEGIRMSRGDLVFCIDADCIVSPDALLTGLSHFRSDPQVAAVAGSVRVSNRSSLLTEYQELEYGIGDLQKAFLSNYGLVNVVPGPVGLFKKSAVQSVGSYDVDSGIFAEDTELTLKLIGAGFKVTFEPKMSSYTEVPENLQALMRQRYRWTRGIYQALRKNISSLQQTHPIFTTYLFLEKVWAPVFDFCVLVFFAIQFIVNAQFEVFFSYSAMIIFTEMIQVFLVMHISSRRYRFFSFLAIIISRFSLSVIITAWKYLSLFEEWGAVEMSWDKLQRVGNPSSTEVENAVC